MKKSVILSFILLAGCSGSPQYGFDKASWQYKNSTNYVLTFVDCGKGDYCYPADAQPHVIEYRSYESCRAAGDREVSAAQNEGYNYEYICVPV